MNQLDIIKAYTEKLWFEKNISAIDEYFAENATINSAYNDSSTDAVKDKEKMKTVIQHWFNAFPDIKVELENFICQDNKVVNQWRATGTHKGTFLEHPPTNKKIEYSGFTMYEVENDKITAYWAVIDMHNIFQQIGSDV